MERGQARAIIIAAIIALVGVLITGFCSIVVNAPTLVPWFATNVPLYMRFSSGGQTTAPSPIPEDTPTQARPSMAVPTPTGTPVPLGFPGNPVTSNAQWEPYISQYVHTFNGIEMVLVPAGCFYMGIAGSGGYQCFSQPFWINRYEIDNRQYGSAGYTTGDYQPHDYVSWFEARDFCEGQLGGRLPTEAEWEYAARGPDDLIFPWGNSWNPDDLIWGNAQPAEVGTQIGGMSWVGAYNLSGNVAEWVSTIYDGFPLPYTPDDGRENPSDTKSARVIKGGSWRNYAPGNFYADARDSADPSHWDNAVGFRCARSYHAGDMNF